MPIIYQLISETKQIQNCQNIVLYFNKKNFRLRLHMTGEAYFVEHNSRKSQVFTYL